MPRGCKFFLQANPIFTFRLKHGSEGRKVQTQRFSRRSKTKNPTPSKQSTKWTTNIFLTRKVFPVSSCDPGMVLSLYALVWDTRHESPHRLACFIVCSFTPYPEMTPPKLPLGSESRFFKGL